MSNFLIRIVVLLLLPCLLEGPALAAAEMMASCETNQKTNLNPSLFYEQALISTAIGAQRYSIRLWRGIAIVGFLVPALLGSSNIPRFTEPILTFDDLDHFFKERMPHPLSTDLVGLWAMGVFIVVYLIITGITRRRSTRVFRESNLNPNFEEISVRQNTWQSILFWFQSWFGPLLALPAAGLMTFTTHWIMANNFGMSSFFEIAVFSSGSVVLMLDQGSKWVVNRLIPQNNDLESLMEQRRRAGRFSISNIMHRVTFVEMLTMSIITLYGILALVGTLNEFKEFVEFPKLAPIAIGVVWGAALSHTVESFLFGGVVDWIGLRWRKPSPQDDGTRGRGIMTNIADVILALGVPVVLFATMGIVLGLAVLIINLGGIFTYLYLRDGPIVHSQKDLGTGRSAGIYRGSVMALLPFVAIIPPILAGLLFNEGRIIPSLFWQIETIAFALLGLLIYGLGRTYDLRSTPPANAVSATPLVSRRKAIAAVGLGGLSYLTWRVWPRKKEQLLQQFLDKVTDELKKQNDPATNAVRVYCQVIDGEIKKNPDEALITYGWLLDEIHRINRRPADWNYVVAKFVDEGTQLDNAHEYPQFYEELNSLRNQFVYSRFNPRDKKARERVKMLAAHEVEKTAAGHRAAIEYLLRQSVNHQEQPQATESIAREGMQDSLWNLYQPYLEMRTSLTPDQFDREMRKRIFLQHEANIPHELEAAVHSIGVHEKIIPPGYMGTGRELGFLVESRYIRKTIGRANLIVGTTILIGSAVSLTGSRPNRTSDLNGPSTRREFMRFRWSSYSTNRVRPRATIRQPEHLALRSAA